MSLLLYYSISSTLTEDEIIEVDRRVAKERKAVYTFVRNFAANGKDGTKRIIVIIALGSVVWFSNLESAEAIGLSTPPTPVVRVHSNYNYTYGMKVAPTVSPKLYKIRLIATSEMIPLIYINGHYSYINDQLLKKLRSGDLSANITVIAIGVVVYIMCQLSGVDAFQIIANWNAPQPSPTFGPGPSSSSTQLSVIPTKAQEFNDMSLRFNEPKPNFIMTRDDALKLLKDTYPGELKITENERFSDWQAAKKVYHASDFGVNLEDYVMTKEQLRQINKVGLTKYVRLGNTLPPGELIKDYQAAVKGFCENSERLPSGTYNSRGDQKVHKSSFYYNDNTRKIVAFNIETQDLITAGTYSLKDFSMFRVTKNLGRL